MPGREIQHPTLGTGAFFSRAIEAPLGRHVYFAGQAPNDVSGATVAGGMAEQADACFGKLQALVEAAGGTTGDFVMLNVYLTDLARFDEVQTVYRRYFTETPLPAVSVYGVAGLLGPDWLIEVDGVAVIPER
jgi:enamine deaminase RidA (YjgF/YER057c/UK114 family)